MSNRPLSLALLTAAALTCLGQSAGAQWVSEQYTFKAGWNAIWLPHDASHDAIDDLFPVSVQEVWRWNPIASPTHFTQSPVAPVQPDTQWLVWKRGFPVDSTMSSLSPNAAYLVKVADGTATFTHAVKGVPAPPRYAWKSSGLNFFGFPSALPETNFETFLSYSSALAAGPDILKYDGGPITANPVAIGAPLFEPVTRGRAYWIRSSQFSDYYGPLRITVVGSGFAFGDTGTVLAMKLRNVTDEAVDATLAPVASEAPPAGETAVAGSVPLRIRGALDLTSGEFTYSDFTATTTLSLAAGEEVEVAFAVDRATMAGSAGDLFASLVRVSDSLGISRIDLPVSAVTTSRAGLWIGAAVVNKVDQVTAAPGPPAPDGQGTVDVTTDADADAPSAFPVRLILHRDAAGDIRLLQKVYLGTGGGDQILTHDEANLDADRISEARRISTSTFPLGAKVTGTGADLGLAGTTNFDVVLAHTAATNPFLHTFHPDHDNKDAQFSAAPLAEGIESYTVGRDIDLSFAADAATLGLNDLGWGSTVLGGTYTETISGLRAQDITVRGSFVLRRVSDIDTFTEALTE